MTPTIGDYVDKEQAEGAILQEAEKSPEIMEHQEQSSGMDWSLLKAQTGPGQIEDYMEHALNFNGSKAVARIIRGATGILGELNYAVVDIAMGLLEMLKGRKKVGVAHVE